MNTKPFGAVALAVLSNLAASAPVCAADPPPPDLLMTHFGVNEGLAGTVIDAIDQTSDGFLCGVRRFRERRGLTQAALAKRLGSSQSRVAKIEAGDASVSIDLMIKSLFGIGARTSDIAALIRSGRSARSA